MTSEDAKSYLRVFADWMTSQSFNNILLMAILVALGTGVKYALDVAIPNHIRMIQSGYEKQEASHERELDRVVELIMSNKVAER
jgi:hypothetical protein